jgi:hypothetical protein
MMVENLSSFLGVDIYNVNDYFKPVAVGKWREAHPDMMSKLPEKFKELLRYFKYENV